MKNPFGFAMLCISLAFACQSRVLAVPLDSVGHSKEPALAKGIKKYQQGFYIEALAALNDSHYDRNDAAEAHYYKGMTLQKLGRDSEAARELKLAALFDMNGRTRSAARNALNKISSASTSIPISNILPPRGSCPPLLRTSRSWQSIVYPSQNSNAYSVSPRLSSSEQEVRECAQRILNQSSERIGNVWKEPRPNPRIDSTVYSFDFPFEATAGNPREPEWGYRPTCGTRIRGQGLSNPYYFDDYRYKFHPGKDTAASLPYNDPHRIYMQDKANNVAKSADGLISLLTRKDDGKGVFLVPEGTNLYVRNYEFGTPIDPPPPVGKKTEVQMLLLPKPVTQKFSPLANSKI